MLLYDRVVVILFLLLYIVILIVREVENINYNGNIIYTKLL